jgi:hypothetical protein
MNMPSSPNLIRLGPLDAVSGRSFTAPEHSHADLATLELIRARLRQTLAEQASALDQADQSEVHVQYYYEEQQRLHRIIIRDHAALATTGELAVVGFFGEQRGKANAALLQDIDTELIQEFLQHRYVLSYSSLELADGNWGNLVILQHIEGIEHWRSSQRHAYAARELAPQYYARIRLHNGLLPSGLNSAHLMLTSTKYYDFEGDELWRAIREGMPYERVV